MKKTRITILVTIFALLSLISILTIYYTHTLPTEEKHVTTLWTYDQYGIYDYVATLKENTVYDNKLTLRPGEGPLYMAITDSVNITFTYRFESSLPANITIRYRVDQTLKTPRWQRLLHRTNQTIREYNGITSQDVQINSIPLISVYNISELVTALTRETGAFVSNYNITITTEINLEANCNEGHINETFTPTIAAEFNRQVTEGNLLSLENLTQTKTSKITQTDIIPQGWVTDQRYFSYALSTVSFPGLVLAIYWFIKTRPAKPTRPEALIEDFIEPFKEIIVEMGKEPQTPKEHLPSLTAISMKTLEDLVKVADILDKPILHVLRPPETHVFYVLDGTTRYEYSIQESSIIKITAKEEEEE